MANDPLVVKRYKSEKAYLKGAKKMAAQGYEVFDVKTESKGRGCSNWLVLGLFAFLLKPKTEWVVTYRLVSG